MKKILSLLIIVVITIVTIPMTLATENNESNKYLNWSQFRGNTGVLGLTDAKTPKTFENYEQIWENKFGGDGWSSTNGSPIIVGNYLYAYGNGKLNRVNRQTGELILSVDCAGSSQFFCQIAYGDGMIFVPRAVNEKTDGVNKSYSIVIAYDEQTMEQIWISEPIGDINAGLQPLSPAIYYNNHIYIGVSNGRADKGAFVCFETTDKDTTKNDEKATALWSYTSENPTAKNGYYWSGGAIVDNSIIFAGESGELIVHDLYTDKIIDKIELLAGETPANIRSTVAYDQKTGRVFLSSKSGYMFSVKVNGDLSFDKTSIISKKLGTDITSSPVVYNGRIYVGGGGISSTDGFMVLNAETLDMIYTIPQILTQSSPIVSVAYATPENNNEVYIYVIKYAGYENGNFKEYSKTSSCIFAIKDSEINIMPSYEVIATPSKLNYCTQSTTIASDGSIYYYNDTGYTFGFGYKNNDGKYNEIDVINAINRLPKTSLLKTDDEFKVKQVKARYDLLSTNLQEKVTNIKVLNEALLMLEKLYNEPEQIKGLNNYILNLDLQKISINDDESINDKLNIYNNLTENGKKEILDIKKLQKANDILFTIKNKLKANEIDTKIVAIKSEIDLSLDDMDAVVELYNEFKLQTIEVQNLVKSSSKLASAYEYLQKTKLYVKVLNDRIWNEINPTDISLSDKENILSIIADYNKLSEKNRKFIENYSDVLDALEEISKLENKSEVTIPKDEITTIKDNTNNQNPNTSDKILIVLIMSCASLFLLVVKIISSKNKMH